MVHVLGCEHYLQEYEPQDLQPEIRRIEYELKENFYAITKEIIGTNGITFVGEECKPSQDTIPRRVAAELGCTYAEIDMAADERERSGIPKNYESLGKDEQERCLALREEYMVARVYRESTLEASKLIVCGALHINGLAKRVHDRGELVTTRNLLDEEWCDMPWDRIFEARSKRLHLSLNEFVEVRLKPLQQPNI